MHIRSPRPEDLPTLLALAKRLHEGSAYASLPFDPKKVAALIITCVTLKATHFAAVAEKGGEVVGYVAGALSTYVFCNEPIANEISIFVHPDHRASTAAVRMIRAFRDWAKAHGAREISVGVSTEVDVERIGALYERMGFRYVGGMYRERLA